MLIFIEKFLLSICTVENFGESLTSSFKGTINCVPLNN